MKGAHLVGAAFLVLCLILLPSAVLRFSPSNLAAAGDVGQGEGSACRIEIEPASPSENDPVSVTLSGWWSNSCVPNSVTHRLAGHLVSVSALAVYPPGTACAEVVSPWELTEALGMLPPGLYRVDAYAFVGCYPPPGATPCASEEFAVGVSTRVYVPIAANDRPTPTPIPLPGARTKSGTDTATDLR